MMCDMNLDSLSWTTDELGSNYRSATLPLGPDPDDAGDVSAVLVQALPDEVTGKPALLWVHGLSLIHI